MDNISEEQTKTVVLTNPVLSFIINSFPKQYQKSTLARLVMKNEALYETNHKLLNELGETVLAPNIKIKLPYFPLDEAYTERAEKVSQLTKKAIALTDTIQGNSHVNLVAKADNQVASLLNQIAFLRESYLTPLHQFSNYQEQELLAYINPEELITKFWKEGLPKPDGLGGEFIPQGSPITKLENLANWVNNSKYYLSKVSSHY